MDGLALSGLAVLAPLVAGIVTLLLPRRAIAARTWIATAGPAVALALVAWHVHAHGIEAVSTYGADVVAATQGTASLGWWSAFNLEVSFLTDGLGVFFALLVAGVAVLINLYARAYFGPEPDDLYRFYPTLGFFTTAMLGIVLADHLLLTLLFWEMTSISSFLLIGWDRYDKKAVKLAMQAFFTTGLGGLVMLGGVLLLGLHTDVWRWSTLLAERPELNWAIDLHNPAMWAFVLIFFGAATKSAQWPFHYWLPGAMAAPTPVSAFLHSATMVKAGVFLVGRMFPVFAAMELWPWLIIPLGAVTMLLGAYVALNQHDLKRIFAYTTVSQLGLLMCMYGLGSLSFVYHGDPLSTIDWDISQIANHALYKAPLFILAGALGHVASRQLPELFGAVRQHKAIVVVMIMAAYALAALPGSISFQAKELFLYAIYHAAQDVHPAFWVLMAMAVATAALNMAIFVRLTTTLLGLGPGLRPAVEAAGSEHAADTPMPDHPPHGAAPYHDQGADPGAPPEPSGHNGEHHHHEVGFWGLMLWLPALILVIPQFVGGLYTPAWNHVFGHLETNVHYFYSGIPALWEVAAGIPLLMSAIAVVLGLVIGLGPAMRHAIVDVHDRIYPALYHAAVVGGGRAFRTVQTGHLRDYVTMILCTFLFAFVGTVVVDPTKLEPLRTELPRIFEFWPGVALGVIAAATAVTIPLVTARVVRVMLLGGCGFSVVGLYLVYEAPDLALTQLMFEIISVILFVLVLRLLPEPSRRERHGWAWRLALSAAVGIAFGWMTLVAATGDAGRPLVAEYPRLGEFFIQHAYDGSALTDGRGGGGGNVVNVILVDFRGFDTLGEIAVLAIAALGVWSLMPSMRRAQEPAP
ncbi:MAG: hydrogen gas-evolving membrane-bound hydrogenase subunit E [Phycisphaeraceae bacterium]